MYKPRIYVSSPHPDNLDPDRRIIREQILEALTSLGFEPQEFAVSGLTKGESWTFSRASELMKECDGAIILALARTFAQFVDGTNFTPVPSEYNHFEGALALAEALPTLVIAEEHMPSRGIIYHGGGQFITKISPDEVPGGLNKERLVNGAHFKDWVARVRGRYDLFLGYCSKADKAAQELIQELEQDFRVMDWARDFRPARTILEEVQRAAATCRCGIFLFTKDDPVESRGSTEVLPRDNVLLEAGYFLGSRGKEKVAIVRETGAKMPADLGGVIYISFDDRSNLDQAVRKLRNFLKQNLRSTVA